MSKFISGVKKLNHVQTFKHGGHTRGGNTSFPRRRGYINDKLGNGYEDDVPAMLTAGEYVIKRSSVQKYGNTFLKRLNQGLVSEDVRYMNRGGQVNNNGRNDMPHRTKRSTRRSSTRGAATVYSSRSNRRSTRRTASPSRPVHRANGGPVGSRKRTQPTRGRVARPVSRRMRTKSGQVQNYAYGGNVMTSRMSSTPSTGRMSRTGNGTTYNGNVVSGQDNGRNTMDNFLQYNGRYYDCHGSQYFTTECSQVGNQQLVDYGTGKSGPKKF